jgi:hypothetical protein
MENLIFFQHHKAHKHVSVWSIDTPNIIHLMRGKSFCIKEMVSDDSDNKLGYIRKPEDADWVIYGDENHTNALQWFIEDCDQHKVFECLIELEGGCEIEQVAGQLFVSYQSPDQIKSGMVQLLKCYGYFAAEKIWDFVMQCDQNLAIPLDTLQGIEPENLNSEHLDFTLKLANNIEEEHIKNEKLAREMDDSEDALPF